MSIDRSNLILEEDCKSEKNVSTQIVNLCLKYHLEESNQYLKMIIVQISACEARIKYLLKTKPYQFQKKKLKAYQEELDEIDNKIQKYYKDISNELKEIQEIQTILEQGNI